MNILEAARDLAKNYPGSYGAMAQRLGKHPDTLRREVNASPGFKLGLEDAEEMTQFAREVAQTNALVLLSAFAANCGQMLMPLPGSPQQQDECMVRLAALAREFSDLVAEVSGDLSDGHVSGNELKRIEGKGGEVISALQSLLASVHSRHEAGKPSNIRRAA
jgi:hypothetical protein